MPTSQSPLINHPNLSPPCLSRRSQQPDPEYPKTGTKEEGAAFFEVCKIQLGSQAEYIKFLKLLTLNKTGLLERFTLTEHVKFNVGENKELFKQFLWLVRDRRGRVWEEQDAEDCREGHGGCQ
jgi:histone deacetylase complex regulatory component SIN3